MKRIYYLNLGIGILCILLTCDAAIHMHNLFFSITFPILSIANFACFIIGYSLRNDP